MGVWSPIPSLPPYTGPYKVGSADFEVPASALNSPAACPDSSVSTISFRCFYPCLDSSKHEPVYWQEPKRDFVPAFLSFLGFSARATNVLSTLPNLLSCTRIPVWRNAQLLSPTTQSGRWPVVIFSHGLGGNRNSYSQICGSIASYGAVVFAPEHRDGSATVSLIHDEKGDVAKRIPYSNIPREANPECEEARTKQLRIRLWEIGLLTEAINKFDKGAQFPNWAKFAAPSLSFTGKLRIAEPGSVVWAGHSFGAATTVQLLKSVYYPSRSETPAGKTSLYTPSNDSYISRQITSNSPTILLDPWALPVLAENTNWLYRQPIPGYCGDSEHASTLMVLSEGFYKWKYNMEALWKILSAKPDSELPLEKDKNSPLVFYAQESAHLSQSDFGLLFPLISRMAFKVEDPERVIDLNIRAILEFLKRGGVELQSFNNQPQDSQSEQPKGERILDDESTVKGWAVAQLLQEASV